MRVDATAAESWATPGGSGLLVHAAATHPGRVRDVNEDASLVAPPLFLVADGMGGYARGDLASRLVVESFEPLAALGRVEPGDLEAAIGTAQARVGALADDVSSAPGSTVVAAAYVTEDGHGYWLVANVGDSRAYSFADGVLEQISKDHSVVQELIDAGRLTPEEALGHPERHVVTRAIGALTPANADFSLVPATPGSRLLLCSDGLTSELSDTAVGHILAAENAPDRAALTLVDSAVAAGGHDNVTVVVVDVAGGVAPGAGTALEDTEPHPGGPR